MLLLSSLVVSAQARFKAELYNVNEGSINLLREKFQIGYTLMAVEETSILPWFTPLDEVWEDVFVVQDDQGAEIPYTGRIAHRLPTTDADFQHFKVGEVHNVTVDLTLSYDIPRDGLYTIALRNLASKIATAPVYSGSNTVSVHIVHSDAQSLHFGRKDIDEDQADYGQCSNQWGGSGVAAVIQGVTVAAESQIPGALNCMSSLCSEYSVWFGAYTSARGNTVSSCWSSISTGLPTANYDCCNGCGIACGQNLYGYVYPSDPTRTIYLCQVYYNQPSERAETITHELSHFNAICGTDDYTYGESNCRALAQSNPSQAIDNADNYCYFGRYTSV